MWLVPAGLLGQIVHEGEVDDSGLLTAGAVGAGAAAGLLDVLRDVRLLARVAGEAVVVVLVTHSCHSHSVSKIVRNFLQRSLLLLLLLLLLVLVVTVEFVLPQLIVEQQIIFHLKEERN